MRTGPGLLDRSGAPYAKLKGAFSAAASYDVGDLVTYQGSLYYCSTAVANSAPSYVGTSAITKNLSPTTPLPLPAGAQSGDIALCLVMGSVVDSSPPAAGGVPQPSGTQLATGTGSGAGLAGRWFLIGHSITASEASVGSIQLTNSPTGETMGYAMVWRNVSLGAVPYSGTPSGNPASTTIASFTPTDNPAFVAFLELSYNYSGLTPNPALGNAASTQVAGGFNPYYGISGSYTYSGSGAVPAQSFQGSSSYTALAAVDLVGLGGFNPGNFTKLGALIGTPNGGTAGQALVKLSSADGDFTWAAVRDASAEHYKGAYSSVAGYSPGDVVVTNGKVYVCKTTIAAGSLPTPSIVGGVGAAIGGSSSSSTNLTLPTGTQLGDLLVLGIGFRSNGTTSASYAVPPTGFSTALNSNAGSNFTSGGVFYKVATSTDIANGFVTLPAQPGSQGIGFGYGLYALRNVDSVDVTSQDTSGSGVTPGLTLRSTSELVFYSQAALSQNQYVTAPASLTNVLKEQSGTSTYGGGSFGLLTPSSTAVGAQTWTITSGQNYGQVVQAVAFYYSGASPSATNWDCIGVVPDSYGRLQSADPGSGTDVMNYQALVNYLKTHPLAPPTYTQTNGSYSLSSTDGTYFYSGSTSNTATLPAASSSNNGTIFVLKNLSTGYLTVPTALDGVTNVSLAPGQSMIIQSDGTAWRLISVLGTKVTVTASSAVTSITMPWMDRTYVCNGTFAVTLPSAAGQSGSITVRNNGTGLITITGTVDGSTSTYVGPGGSLTFVSDGSSWYTADGNNKMRYRGGYNPSATYAPGDVITNAGRPYIATAPISSATTFIGYGQLFNVSATAAQNISLPAGCAVGDLAIFEGTPNPAGTVAPSITAHGTVTQLFSSTNRAVYSVVLDATDIARGYLTVPIVGGSATAFSAHVAVFRGVVVDSSNPVASSASATFPSVTLSKAGFAYYAYFDSGTSNNPAWPGSVTAPAGAATYTWNGSSPFAFTGFAYVAAASGAAAGFSMASYAPQNLPLSVAVPLVATSSLPAAFSPLGLTLPTGGTAGQSLIKASSTDGDAAWGTPTGVLGRSTSSVTTGNLASGARVQTTVQMAPGYLLYKVVTGTPCRVRVYATAAQQAADATRAIGTDPTGDHGLMLEFVSTSGLLAKVLTPMVMGASMEATPSGSIPITIDNLDSVTEPVTVTLTWARTEAG